MHKRQSFWFIGCSHAHPESELGDLEFKDTRTQTPRRRDGKRARRENKCLRWWQWIFANYIVTISNLHVVNDIRMDMTWVCVIRLHYSLYFFTLLLFLLTFKQSSRPMLVSLFSFSFKTTSILWTISYVLFSISFRKFSIAKYSFMVMNFHRYFSSFFFACFALLLKKRKNALCWEWFAYIMNSGLYWDRSPKPVRFCRTEHKN